MRKATSLLALFGSLLVVGIAPAVAKAELLSEPILGFQGEVLATPVEVGGEGLNPGVLNAVTTAYDNTASAANFGFSSTDLTSIWGDELNLVTTGVLSTHLFTIFNPGTSAGPLLTTVVALNFFDSMSAAHLGGYTVNVNFGAGLPPGFYSIVTVQALDGLGIVIPNTGVVVQQQIMALTGTANRLGIASLNPPTIGSSPISMFIQSATVNGGVPGFYNIGNPPQPANPGYQLGLEQVPTSTLATTWGRVKALTR